MPKIKTIELIGKQVTLQELKVQDILDMWDDIKDDGLEGIIRISTELLKRTTHDLTIEDLKKMYGSDMEKFYNAFKEVNSCFFSIAQAINLGEIMGGIRAQLMPIFGGLFAELFAAGITTKH